MIEWYVLRVIVLPLLITSASNSEDSSSPWDEFFRSKVQQLQDDCESKEIGLINCLKVKAVALIDKASKSDSIIIDESISLIKEGGRSEYSRALNENEIESSLANYEESSIGTKLNDMLFERISGFLNSHVVKIGLPKIDAKSLIKDLDEGRGKMKKTMGMFMMAAMMKAMMMIPLSIGTLFILAGKALIISKIALVLSLLLTLKKLLSKSSEHIVHETHGWGGGSGSGGWDRRYQVPANGQNMAYNSYINH